MHVVYLSEIGTKIRIKMSQNKSNIQLTGKFKQTKARRERRKQIREKYAQIALIETQGSNYTDCSQSQPPNVYPENFPNIWTPNLPTMPMQSMPQDPWAQPQANNNIFNFGPTNLVGNCFPPNNIQHFEQPLANENNNMGIQTFPHQSNQPKKIRNKPKIKQQPKKKLKAAELSFEEKQKREAELRIIEQKYRQVVMIHKSVTQSQPTAPPVPRKRKTNKVTPSKQHVPVATVVPRQIQTMTIGNTTVTPTPLGQSLQPPATGLIPTKPINLNRRFPANVDAQKKWMEVIPGIVNRNTLVCCLHFNNRNYLTDARKICDLEPFHQFSQRQRSRKNKKNQNYNAPYTHQVQAVSTSQYQAPHQDEPEDLTDDLAPNMAGGQQQPGTQPRAVTVDNKLNFKFQRSVPKNSDWSEYQNKFRRIGGGSPEPEPAGADQVKQEPNQSINTGSIAKPPIQSQSVTEPQLKMTRTLQNTGSTNANRPPTVTQTVAQQKPAVTPKVEIIHKPASQKQPQIPRNPMEMKSQRNANQKPITNPFYHPYDNHPKGIPKSFLIQAPQAPQPNPAFDYANEPHYQAEAARQAAQPSPHIDLPSWILASQAQPEPQQANVGANPPMFPTMFAQREPPERVYSPTDVYSETPREEEPHEGSESPDTLQSNQKRQSAFSRLGPLAQPKKPKLTINLMLNKEQAVREVVDETDVAFRYVPVHLRKDILESTDETVKKYLPFWPWKKNMTLRKTVSARYSKSVMILEQEQMETAYEKNSLFIQVSVKGYPQTWNKEDVLDAILDCVKGKHFIPSFIEFTPQECKFLVIRCKDALLAIHKVGFYVRARDVELTVSVSLTDTSLNQIDLIPRLVLRKKLMAVYDGENTLNLEEFFIEKDVSHFVYFPLNRHTNQLELIQLQSAVSWEYLTDLNLSRNKLTLITGFNLCKTTPRLKRLDLSHNYIDKLTILLPLRDLPLRALKLEGNPLCHDYIDSAHYVKVVRMMFSEVRELDGVRLTLKGDLPPTKRNYCPESAVPIVEKFLETFFPLLEAYDERGAIEDMYDKDAVLTITFRHKLRYGTAYRYFRNLFLRARSLEEGELESVAGAGAIAALLLKWPAIQHDRYAMTVDVLHHDDFTTILRIGGILKLTAETLAEDEHLLTFARTAVLRTRSGAEYKIQHEMLHWDVPREEVVRDAFNVTTVRPRQLSLKLESPPDEDLKSKLVDIFVKLADIDKKRGARCLELKNWNLRSALEYYIALLKLDDLSALSAPKESTPVPQAS